MTTTTHTRNVMVLLLNYCIVILNTNLGEVPSGKGGSRVMNAVLALVWVTTPVLRPLVSPR